MLCVLILAGGIGSRFWPQSTEERPKQFLKLLGDKTMIQMTYDQMKQITSSENIFVSTNSNYVDMLKEQLPDISDSNIICEPYFKNTGPSILLSSLYIKKIYPDANVVCVASDIYIGNEKELIKSIKLASSYVTRKNDAIVVVGVNPTRPETGYGYIEYQKDGVIPSKVTGFIEKPDIKLAKDYLASKKYLWNTGVFIYNNENMLKEIKNNLPVEYELLKKLIDVDSDAYYEYLDSNYQKCKKISISNAVLEKSINLYVIPANIDWDDVGSWESLERYIKKDDNDNIIKGDAKIIGGHNNIIYGNGKKIVLVNANDLFCIDSNDTIIIGRKEDLSNVYLLKDKIEKGVN